MYIFKAHRKKFKYPTMSLDNTYDDNNKVGWRQSAVMS